MSETAERFNPPITHILVYVRSQDVEMLYRADTGIMVGQQKEAVVVFGEEPHKKSSRVFLNSEFARKFLRAHATEDCKLTGYGFAANVEERDGEPIISLAGGDMGFAKIGESPMPFNNSLGKHNDIIRKN